MKLCNNYHGVSMAGIWIGGNPDGGGRGSHGSHLATKMSQKCGKHYLTFGDFSGPHLDDPNFIKKKN